jgi:hypothetical protein
VVPATWRVAALAAVLLAVPAAVSAQDASAQGALAGVVPQAAAPRFSTGSGLAGFTQDGRGVELGSAAQPRRQTRRIARYGAIAGGIAGAGVGGFMALWCTGTASDGCFWALPVVTGLGIVSGAAGGAILGAAVPGPGHDGVTPIASGGVMAGVARATLTRRGLDEAGEPLQSEQTGPMARVHVYAELTPWFGLGPELGIASFGDAGDVRHIAVSTRFFMAGGRVAPFATVHLGAYDSTDASLEYLGGGVGIGARIQPAAGRRFFVDVEGRHSRNAQNIEPMRMWSLGVSGGVYW